MGSSENELWICFYFTLFLQLIWTHLLCCSAFDFCNPEKDSHFCTFLITATEFHVIFVRLTLPKAQGMRLHNLYMLADGLARVTCDFKYSQRKRSGSFKSDELGCHSVAYRQAYKSPDVPIRGQNENLLFCLSSCITLSFFNRIWWRFPFQRAN